MQEWPWNEVVIDYFCEWSHGDILDFSKFSREKKGQKKKKNCKTDAINGSWFWCEENLSNDDGIFAYILQKFSFYQLFLSDWTLNLPEPFVMLRK